jgi:hypothetical protein
MDAALLLLIGCPNTNIHHTYSISVVAKALPRPLEGTPWSKAVGRISKRLEFSKQYAWFHSVIAISVILPTNTEGSKGLRQQASSPHTQGHTSRFCSTANTHPISSIAQILQTVHIKDSAADSVWQGAAAAGLAGAAAAGTTPQGGMGSLQCKPTLQQLRCLSTYA